MHFFWGTCGVMSDYTVCITFHIKLHRSCINTCLHIHLDDIWRQQDCSHNIISKFFLKNPCAVYFPCPPSEGTMTVGDMFFGMSAEVFFSSSLARSATCAVSVFTASSRPRDPPTSSSDNTGTTTVSAATPHPNWCSRGVSVLTTSPMQLLSRGSTCPRKKGTLCSTEVLAERAVLCQGSTLSRTCFAAPTDLQPRKS